MWMACLAGLVAAARETPASLAEKLVQGKHTDREKVMAFVDWITNNISYTIRKPNPRPDLLEDKDDAPLPSLDERVSLQVLERRSALCDGYARLFNALCSHAGIRSEIIKGYARPREFRYRSRFGINHFWNAVWLEGRWQLLDLTWASGYLTRAGDQFIQHYDGYYILANPKDFIADHYPDDLGWTLMPEAQLPPEFHYSPFHLLAFPKYGIRDYFPPKGLVKAAKGDTLRFRLKLDEFSLQRAIGPAVCGDTSCYTDRPDWIVIGPRPAAPGATSIEYELPLGETIPEWVCLQYNGDLVLRYKIELK